MLKKICVIVSSLIVLCGAVMVSTTPVFSDYGDRFEVYLNSSSSLAKAVSVSGKQLIFLKNVEGESVKVSAKGFNLDELFKEFDATVKFTEQAEQVVIYYTYSPKIKYRKKVKGERVNLQVAVGREQITLGAPLIFGSF